MKKLSIVIALLFFAAACMKQEESTVAYVVGYNNCNTFSTEDGTVKAKLHLLVSENLKDTLVTHNLPDELFAFPAMLLPRKAGFYGYSFFPQEYRYAYKVQITYRPMTEEEIYLCIDFGFYTDMVVISYPQVKYVVVEQISKIQ